jgi:hypothetical protein
MNCWAETGARLLIAASAAQRRRFRADLTQPVSDRDWARRGGERWLEPATRGTFAEREAETRQAKREREQLGGLL